MTAIQNYSSDAEQCKFAIITLKSMKTHSLQEVTNMKEKSREINAN